MRFLRSLLIAFCATVLSSHANPPPKPNIIFILCDDLGYGDTGTFFQNLRATTGDRSEPWHATPRLDAMAAAGLRLPHHYCPAPVCAPSRASLLLGVHQGHANVRDNQFDKGLEANHTIGSLLKKAGYATAAIGKWGLQGKGNAPGWEASPLKRGFDFYYGYIRHGDGHQHYPKENRKQVWEMRKDITAQCDKSYTTDLFTARSKKWITDHQAADSKQPFLLYLAYDTPHAILQLPTSAYPSGGGISGGLQYTGTPGQIINTAVGSIDSYYHPDYANATWDEDRKKATPEVPWPDVYKRYATSVRRIDDATADLLQTLKDLKIDQNTLIVFTTDNGPSKESYLPEAYVPDFFNSFGPFSGIKRDCLEGGIRVGAIVYWPGGVPAGRTSLLPCQFHDWLPTFAQLAGLTPPARTDGTSLVPTLTNTGTQAIPQVYVEYVNNGKSPGYPEFPAPHRSRRRDQMQMIREGDYTGVRYGTKSEADDFEIYDVINDPAQLKNVASKQPALQQRMKEAVLRLRRPNPSAPRPYDDAPIPSVKPGKVAPGLIRHVFDDSFDYVPDPAYLKASSSSISPRPDPAGLPATTASTVLWTGYLQVPATGSYTIFLTTQSKAYLRLHQASLVDADQGYVRGTEITATVQLAAGYHPWRFTSLAPVGGPAEFILDWSGPDIPRQPIPASAFVHRPITP